MAKKKRKAQKLSSRLNTLAEDLGTFLGTSERKANEWLARQQQLRKQLSAIRDKATALLSQLGPGVEKKGAGAKASAKATKTAKSAKPAAKNSAKKASKPTLKPAARKAPKAAPKPAASAFSESIDMDEE